MDGLLSMSTPTWEVGIADPGFSLQAMHRLLHLLRLPPITLPLHNGSSGAQKAIHGRILRLLTLNKE